MQKLQAELAYGKRFCSAKCRADYLCYLTAKLSEKLREILNRFRSLAADPANRRFQVCSSGTFRATTIDDLRYWYAAAKRRTAGI